jgi:endonuclease YncB( thermonuclease family)
MIELKATVKFIYDGDTFLAKPFLPYISNVKGIEIGEKEKIRLAYIDAPEYDTYWGKLAKQRLREILKIGSLVSLSIKQIDQYNRKVCNVYLYDNTYLNELLVREGFATVYKYFVSQANQQDKEILINAENYAKFHSLNLWSDYFTTKGANLKPETYYLTTKS